LLCLSSVAYAPKTVALVSPKSHLKSGKGKKLAAISEPQKQSSEDTKRLDKLTESALAYKDNPNNETYTQLWQDFESWVCPLAAKHIDASNFCKASQVLSKAGLKIIDTTSSGLSAKIYTFSPHAIWAQTKLSPAAQPVNRDILIQWLEPGQAELIRGNAKLEKHRHLHGKMKKSHLWTARKAATMHTQSLNIPPNVEIKQSCLLNGSKAHFLAMTGVDWQSGRCWLEGLKHTSAGWANDADLWQQVPTSLLQTGQSKVRFSENSLIITIGSRSSADNNTTGSSYELVMPFVDNRFALMRNEAQDTARAVALQLMLAIQGKRPDMVKIWLVDPQLASIPGYLGLYNRSADSPSLKLINMSSPLNGGARFRLITNTKDDLIVDVGRVKGQWLVKGLFITSADSLASELGRIIPAQ
jgi:hypothetical protein